MILMRVFDERGAFCEAAEEVLGHRRVNGCAASVKSREKGGFEG